MRHSTTEPLTVVSAHTIQPRQAPCNPRMSHSATEPLTVVSAHTTQPRPSAMQPTYALLNHGTAYGSQRSHHSTPASATHPRMHYSTTEPLTVVSAHTIQPRPSAMQPTHALLNHGTAYGSQRSYHSTPASAMQPTYALLSYGTAYGSQRSHHSTHTGPLNGTAYGSQRSHHSTPAKRHATHA